jgi:hypothetical protein
MRGAAWDGGPRHVVGGEGRHKLGAQGVADVRQAAALLQRHGREELRPRWRADGGP